MSGGRIGVFIDRDGTLNEERDFLTDPAEFRLIDGAAAAVRELNRAGVVTCIISNQSGVARGYLTEEMLALIHERMLGDLERGGAHIDRVYYCPHHPEAGQAPYRMDCECRKPKPGMLRTAAEEFGLDLHRSFVIGDKLDDIRAGMAVDAGTVLVLTGYGQASLERSRQEAVTPGHIAPSIREAVAHILRSLT